MCPLINHQSCENKKSAVPSTLLHPENPLLTYLPPPPLLVSFCIMTLSLVHTFPNLSLTLSGVVRAQRSKLEYERSIEVLKSSLRSGYGVLVGLKSGSLKYSLMSCHTVTRAVARLFRPSPARYGNGNHTDLCKRVCNHRGWRGNGSSGVSNSPLGR